MGTMKKLNVGSNNNGKGAFVWKKNVTPSEHCEWGNVDMAILRRAVSLITAAGGAVMLGVTSDGGAFSVCVLYRDQKIKEYPHGASECEDLLGELADSFQEEWTG